MESNWMNIVGMITGVFGAILSVIAYRKSNALKKLDLRLEFRKSINKAQSDIASLEELMNSADRSRSAILSAIGMLKSGSSMKWNAQITADRGLLPSIKEKIPNPETNYDSFSEKELESNLVKLHQTQVEIDGLIKKYESAISSDDEERRQLREEQRNNRAIQSKST